MKNIHVLKSDKPSRLHLGGSGLVLCVSPFNNGTISSHHIYITSDEEIKEGDWILDIELNRIEKCQYSGVFRNWKKIILTTDQDLIADGIQEIDDEFLEWVVKNPSCEEVEFSIMNKGYNKKEDIPYQEFYKIIIPKEEPKCTCKEHDPYCCQIHGSCPTCVKKEEPKQETLEEAYQRGYERGLNALIPLIDNLQSEISKLKRNL